MILSGIVGCQNNQQICNNTFHTNTLYTLLVTIYQASTQTVEGQQTFSNPHLRFAETVKSYYTFGNPHSSSAETIEGWYTFGNPCSSSAETIDSQYTFGNPRSTSAVTVGVQSIFGNNHSSLVDIRKSLQYARRRLVMSLQLRRDCRRLVDIQRPPFELCKV